MDEVSAPKSPCKFLTKVSRPGGPVTCVSIPPFTSSDGHENNNCVISARGPYLEKSDGKAGNTQQLLVFPRGGTIHGIHYFLKNKLWDAVVFGGSNLAICKLLGGNNITRMEILHSSHDVHNSNRKREQYLTVKDWIWAAQCISTEKDPNTVTLVIGLASHTIEYWKIEFDSKSNNDDPQALVVTRQCQINGNPSCLLMSMDLLTIKNDLWVAAGTAFHEICVWSYPIVVGVDNNNSHAREPVQHCLKGHAGVVHSVKFSSDGQSLASTSDDRSVRLWNQKDGEWVLQWVGWGHSARVWSVAFAPALDMIVSTAEDGTTRLWSCSSGSTLGFIQHSCSLWTVDTSDDIAAVGGTDGTVNVYNLSGRVLLEGQRLTAIDSVPIPDDRPKGQDATIKDNESKDEACQEGTLIKKKKKKKKSSKSTAQIVVGIKWESVTDSDATLLVATRAGSLMRLCVKDKTWKILEPWWVPTMQEHHNILPSDGCCMAIHGHWAAIGTTKGDVALVKTIIPCAANHHQILTAKGLKAVQGLKWISETTLVSFHVFSVAFWSLESCETSESSTIVPIWILQFDKKHKGVPLSCAYDKEEGVVIIGDSRGNLTLFDLKGGEDSANFHTRIIESSSTLPRSHQKEHVTDISLQKNGQVLSVGNDGCLCISYINPDKTLKRGWSIPASSMTGISKIWNCSDISNNVCVSGFYGNTFRMIDVMTSHEFFQLDTGGRQRTHDCLVNFPINDPGTEIFSYGMAICMNQKDGSNSLLIRHLWDENKCQSVSKTCQNVPKTLNHGICMHSETIFSACFFSIDETTFLLTGSEDCTSKISSCQGGHLVDSVTLTPQESCVRAVCSSQSDESSALLVVGGGKVVLQFFLVESSNKTGKDIVQSSVKNLEISFLGQCQNRNGAGIDHRINAVHAVPLKSDHHSRSHLVVAGDSDGCCHIFCVSENINSRLSPGLAITTSPRPILCVDLLKMGDRVLAVIGTTGGDVLLFDLPGSDTELSSHWNDLKSMWVPLAKYQAHQMGTNAISGSIYKDNESNETRLKICSGGDDQGLCVCDVSLTLGVDGKIVLACDPKLQITRELSFSALKGVFQFIHLGHRFLLTVGYSQTLALWQLCDDDEQPILQDQISVDLGDVNCLAVSSFNPGSDLLVASGGMGVENICVRTSNSLLLDKT